MLTATKGGKINISEEKDTKSVAEKFSKLIKQGDFILISGNLGVGKTTFIKHLINSLQKANKQKISEVTSPTFNITNEYQIKKTYWFEMFSEYDGDLKPQLNEGITKVKWIGPKKLKKVKKNIYANIESLI